MIEINAPNMHLRIDRTHAADLLSDLNDIRYVAGGPSADALAVLLEVALREPEPATVEHMPWGPGTWRKTSSGAHEWRRTIVSDGGRRQRRGPVLARIPRLGAGSWKPYVFPYGEHEAPGMPVNVVDHRSPERTLWEAQDTAMQEFLRRRRDIEGDVS